VAPELWVLGKIVGVFGVRGEVRLWLDNPDSSWLFEGPRDVLLRAPDGSERRVELRARSGAGKRVLGRIQGHSRREEAEALMGWQILVPRDVLPEPEEGAWYVEDLLGLEVVTASGRALGELVEVHQNAPVEVWEVRGPGGTCYVPVLLERIVEVGERVVVSDDGVVFDDDQR
jgi:16S rRNA processing protein RimM